MKPLFLVFIIQIFLLSQLSAQQAKINIVNQERNSSYRGLSVVDDTTVWVSGSNGTVGLSTDAGKTGSGSIQLATKKQILGISKHLMRMKP